MEKQKILLRISSLTAEQLFDEIKQGNVTLEELKATGNLDIVKRKKIDDLLKQLDTKDDEVWDRIKYSTDEMDFRQYITSFRNGKHIEEAENEVTKIRKNAVIREGQKKEILDKLKRNPNSFSPNDINSYLKYETITQNELSSCGIPSNIIESINNINPLHLQLGKTPDSIPVGYTEVYFWGIPGSGKTCALGAILNTAEQFGLLNIATGPGYDYMTNLKNIFIDAYPILPPPSPVETTQYLPFTLKKADEKHSRSVSLIELSGEIFQCFFYVNAGLQFPSQSHKDTFDSLNKFLNGNNRKIHFFFIDYDKENRKDSSNRTQSDYLAAAATFFSRKDCNIFGKTTDAIYIILTKSDLMPCSKDEREAKAKEHLKKNFPAFINTLKSHCEKHSINAKKLTYEPFSLGKVYLQQICDFDNSSATKIIDILVERIAPKKESVLDLFNS